MLAKNIHKHFIIICLWIFFIHSRKPENIVLPNYSYKLEEKYFSLPSADITTIFLSLGSSLASFKAAKIVAPEDIPIRTPSFSAYNFAILKASSSLTFIIESTTELSYIHGTKPAPIPCILCGPAFSPDKIADFSGSTATTLMLGFNSFNLFPIPVIVPPVPTPATKISISFKFLQQ